MNEVSQPAVFTRKMVVRACAQRALDLEHELELLSELGSFLLLGLDF